LKKRGKELGKSERKTKKVTFRGSEKNQMIVPWKEERKAPLVLQKKTRVQLIREVKKTINKIGLVLERNSINKNMTTRKVGKESRHFKGKQEGGEKMATIKGRSRNGRAMKEDAITMCIKKAD
jgi:hypothetical protein